MPTWTNPDGLPVRFGVDQGDRKNRAGVTTGAGKRRELVLFVTLTGAARTIYSADLNNDGTLDGFNGLDTLLPAGAVIKAQTVEVIETPAGGTNYAVGTYQVNGTVDDADGIRTTTGTDGVQIGTQLAAARAVSVVTTGTYTAGKIKVVVEYFYQ